MSIEDSNQRSFEDPTKSEIEIDEILMNSDDVIDEILDVPDAPVTTAYRRANQVAGLLVALLGLGLVTGGLELGLTRGNSLGPGMFPLLMGNLLIFLGLCLVVVAQWGKIDRSGDTLLPDRQGAKRLVMTAVLTIVLLWIFPWLGYQISMFLYILGMLVFVGARKVVNSIIISMVFSVGSFLLFTQALGLYLPLSVVPFLRVIGI